MCMWFVYAYIWYIYVVYVLGYAHMCFLPGMSFLTLFLISYTHSVLSKCENTSRTLSVNKTAPQLASEDDRSEL